MKTSTRKHVRALLLACGTCLTSPAFAETNLTFGTLFSELDGYDSLQYGLAARQTVGTLNAAGSAAVRYGHEVLGLDEAGPLARGLYTATAYHALLRFHWANSLYFGHEGSHFARAHHFGMREHYFRDSETGERLSNWDAYQNIFLNLEVGGPAVSSGEIDDDEHYGEHGIMGTAAGLNWQMDYSEHWLRQAWSFQDKDAFDAPEFFMNRLHFMGYATGDIIRREDGNTSGDVFKWARYMEEKGFSDENTLEKVAAYSAVANLLSPGFWHAAGAVGAYIGSGVTETGSALKTTAVGSYGWDIPHYLNRSSMTVAPTLYWVPETTGAKDTFLFGAGLELPVIGEADPELRLSATGRHGSISFDTTLALADGGAYAEASVNYHLDDNFALNLGGALGRGETLGQARQMPASDAAAWAGGQFSF